MSAQTVAEKPHAVCIPLPAQGHINPMLNLTKLLHHRGFHITFVNTEYNHKRLLKSRGPNSLDGLPDFRFETIPDGLPPSEDVDATQDILAFFISISKSCLLPFRNLLRRLNDTSTSNVPPVTCIIFDAAMTLGYVAAKEIGIPGVVFYTASACSCLSYTQYPFLIERGILPPKDAGCLTNGYMDKTMDWIPALKNLRLKDLPDFITSIEPNNVILDFFMKELDRISKASAIILNTFDAFEHDVLDALSAILPPIYTVGPLHLLVNQISDVGLKGLGSNLWKEESECVEWLNSNEPNSVVYVNFGSLTVLTPDQLIEFAWGLANSKKPFLWIIRPDLVAGESAILPPDFVTETEGRSLLASWCPQEQVLMHPSIGWFLTHCGWNSIIESVCGGVPIMCWPFFIDQQQNCRFSCIEWGIGMEIDNDVNRDEIEKLLIKLMEGDVGKEMKEMVMKRKNMAEKATKPDGSSYKNLDKLISQVLLSKTG